MKKVKKSICACSTCNDFLDHPLANVENVFNSILLKGDAIGDVMFYGRGAGKSPTASSSGRYN